MSRPQSFPDLPTALAAFTAGQCRRWVMVDGQQWDLLAAANPCKPSRPVDDRDPIVPSQWAESDPEAHDYTAAQNVAAELARASGGWVTLPDAVTSEAAPAPHVTTVVGSAHVITDDAPPVEVCRACGRPLIGGAM